MTDGYNPEASFTINGIRPDAPGDNFSGGPCRHCGEYRTFRNGKLEPEHPRVCLKNPGAACEIKPLVLKV
jgi:hypothetical protein